MATLKGELDLHKRAVMKGKVPLQVMWTYGTSKGYLNRHKRAVHEGMKYPWRQCERMATSKGNLDRHKITVHERVKYPFRQCEHNTTTKGHLGKQKREIHEGVICSLCLQVIKEDAIKQTHEERLHCKLIIYWKLSISKYECCLKQPQFLFFDNVGQCQPSGAEGTRSPPATPQRLQHLNARLIQHGWGGMEMG